MSRDWEDLIAKLIAQAEDGGATEEEAAAFAEQAQTLATRFGIDVEVARQRQADKTKRETPTIRRITTGGRAQNGRGLPGNKYHVWLALALCDVNDVKANISYRSDWIECFGMPSDIDMVQALYTSLSVQMLRAELEARDLRDRWTTLSDWKSGFYLGFIKVVKQRLWVGRREAIREADIEHVGDDVAGTGAELVLSNKADEVKKFYGERSSATGSWAGGLTQSQRTNGWRGRGAGESAGQRARLTGAHALDGPRTAVGR